MCSLRNAIVSLQELKKKNCHKPSTGALKSVTKMLILEEYRFLARFFGSHQSGLGKLKYQFMAVGFLVMTFFYILAPLDNQSLRQLIASIISLSGLSPIFVFVLHILINGAQFDSLENALQDIVKESRCKHCLVIVEDRSAHINYLSTYMFYSFWKGIRLKKSYKLYAQAEQQISFYAEIAKKNIYLLIATGLVPFACVAYDCCLGKYTIESWIFLMKFWWVFLRCQVFRSVFHIWFISIPQVPNWSEHNIPVHDYGFCSILHFHLFNPNIVHDLIVLFWNHNLH